MEYTIIDIAHHRNGIDGAPFTVILFDETDPDASRKLAILFDEHHHCAVLDVAKLFAGDIAFGSNSWRGDTYEPFLRKAISASPPLNPPEINIDELLAKRREIAVIWSIEDVEAVRPDLTADQCWEVLETARDSHDASIGLDWSVLESHAEMLFGSAPETDPRAEE